MVCLDNVLFINVDSGSCTIVLLLWKTIFLNVVFFVKVIQSLCHDAVHIFGSSLHCAGKFMSKLYAAYIAGLWQIFTEKYVFELSTHFQSIHSNSFILSRGFTLTVFSSYGRKNRRTRFVFDKNNRF